MSEAEFQKEVARWHPARFRIEPSVGSTFGLPDVMLVGAGGRVIFAELKYGTLKKGSELDFELRPSQRRVISEMTELGMQAVVLCRIDTGGVLICRPGEWTYSARRTLSDGLGTGNCTWLSIRKGVPSPDLWSQIEAFLATRPMKSARRRASVVHARRVSDSRRSALVVGSNCIAQETIVSNNKGLKGK